MMRLGLLLAVVGLTLASLYHLVLIFADPAWSEFAGAPPEIVVSLREGSWLAPVSIAAIAAALLVMAGYGLSAAQIIPPWPLTRWALFAIAGLFLLRGLAIVPQILTADFTQFFDQFHIFASLIVILIGLAYLLAALFPSRVAGEG